MGNGSLDLDVEYPAPVVLNGANLVIRAAIGERKEGDMALDLLVVALGLAVIALLAILEGAISGRLATFDVDFDILILVVIDVLKVKHDAIVFEIKGDLAQGLVRGTMRRINAKIPGVTGLVVVLGEDKGCRVRNPLVLAMLSAPVKRAMLSFTGFEFEVGKGIGGYCPKRPVKGVKEGRSHLLLSRESRSERG